MECHFQSCSNSRTQCSGLESQSGRNDNDFLRIGTPRSRLNGLLPAGFPKNSLFLPKLTQPSDHRRPADQTAPHAAGQVPKNRGKIRKAAENTPCFRSLRAPRAEGDKSKDWVAEGMGLRSNLLHLRGISEPSQPIDFKIIFPTALVL